MNHPEHAVEARAREERAREREARAVAHQRMADRRAREATDPQSASALRAEAEHHARAAEVRRRAIEVQVEHAREHES